MLIYRFGNWKPSKVPIDELFKATLIVLEIGIMEPRAQVLGGVGIFDLEGLSMNHTLQMSPSVAQKMIAMMVVRKIFANHSSQPLSLIRFFRLHCHIGPTQFTSSTKAGFSTLPSLSSSHSLTTPCDLVFFCTATISNHFKSTSTRRTFRRSMAACWRNFRTSPG